MNIDIKSLFPRASQACILLNAASTQAKQDKNDVQPIVERKNGNHETNHQRKIQDPKPQHHQTPALDSANERETKGLDRVSVRFTGYRVRPLDPDNFAGSVKDLLDGLRHASIITGDEWWRITLETRQEKVKTYAEEKTVIEIETI